MRVPTAVSKAAFINVARSQYGLTQGTEWFDWENAAEEPVKIRTALDAHKTGPYRLARFVLDIKVHKRLVEWDGYYLFLFYKINNYDSIIVTHHALRKASDFEFGTGKNLKVNPRDLFVGVEG